MPMLSFLKRKYDNLRSDKKFSEILTGSAFSLGARVGGTALALLSTVLVARVYGAEMMGVLAIVQAFMMMAVIFAVLGTEVSLLRLIPEHIAKYSVTSAFRVYRKAQWLVSFVSLLVGGGFFFFADQIAYKIFAKPYLSFYIALTSLSVIFKALMDLNTHAVRGLRLIRTFAFMQILPHTTMLIILLGMIVFSQHSNDPVYAQLAAWGVTALIGVMIMDRAFRQRIQAGDVVQPMRVSKLVALSTPMFMAASMNFIIAQVGVLILGMYWSESEVGYYAAAVKLATLTSFVLQAINSMVAPMFSELFHTGQLEELFYVAQKSTKLIFWSTTPILFFLILLGHPILSLFGEGFTAAYFPMLILVVGQFVNSVSGSTGYFMNMTCHQGMFRNIMIIASATNLLMNFAFVPRLGLLGAAISATLSLALWNFWILIYIKMKYGSTIGYFPSRGAIPRFLNWGRHQ